MRHHQHVALVEAVPQEADFRPLRWRDDLQVGLRIGAAILRSVVDEPVDILVFGGAETKQSVAVAAIMAIRKGNTKDDVRPALAQIGNSAQAPLLLGREAAGIATRIPVRVEERQVAVKQLQAIAVQPLQQLLLIDHGIGMVDAAPPLDQ